MMPSMNATAAVASSPVSHQLTRELLRDGFTVALRIPENAQEGSYPTEDGTNGKYVKFFRGVKGGKVNMFFHHETPEQALGKWVVADGEIWRKTFPDGRQYLYIDLVASQAGATATHVLAVMPEKRDALERPENSLMFELPRMAHRQIVGTIVVAPLGSKILKKKWAPRVIPAKKTVAAWEKKHRAR